MRRIAASDDIYFLTITIVDWIDVFTRPLYKEYLVQNLSYCQQHKGLKIFAYVIMTNHIHLVAQTEGNMSNWLRDFKSYTSKGLYKLIGENPEESRKEWMLQMFNEHGEKNELNKAIQLWQNGSHPTPIQRHHNHMLQQKIDYIHDNPVRAGFVPSAEMYLYSSAHPQSPLKMND